MKTGVYLYCIREKTDSKLPAEGLGGDEIFTVSEQDVEAVVSKISSEGFDLEEIQKEAPEDSTWTEEKALHEKVTEEAMGLQFPPYPWSEDPLKNTNPEAIIPMKFGTIFKTKENLEKTLKKHYTHFKEDLEKLKGKQEWSVKSYLNRQAFEKEVKKISTVVQKKEKEIAQIPEGMAYFMKKEIDDTVSKEADKILQNFGESFFETLKQHTEAGANGKILEKELTGKSPPLVLNMMCLVSEEKLKDFIKEIDNLNEEYKPRGFNFEYSGPWPPYNFI